MGRRDVPYLIRSPKIRSGYVAESRVAVAVNLEQHLVAVAACILECDIHFRPYIPPVNMGADDQRWKAMVQDFGFLAAGVCAIPSNLQAKRPR